MDNLTHTLLGVMMSRAGFNRLVPRATLLLAISANLPDADVATWAGGPLCYLAYHRGWTHGLTFAPLLALAPALLVWLLEGRKVGLPKLWAVALAGVFSHPLLDLTNIYGVRLLLPFASSWKRMDTVNVVDIWIWTILLLGLAAPALSGLVSAEIGARQRGPRGRGWAWFSIVLLIGYEWGRWASHERAVAAMESRIYSGAEPRSVAAFPGSGNPFHWRGLVETESAFLIFDDVDVLSSFDPMSGRMYYKPEAGPEIRAASQTAPFRVFLDFSPYTLWRVTPPSDATDPAEGTRVEAFDLRFGNPGRPGFMATAVVGPDGRARDATFTFGQIRPR